MQLHFAKAYTEFLISSALYHLRYQPATGRVDRSVGEMWLKRFLAEETNDQGQTYQTLQAPFGITLDQEKQEGLNVERLNEKFETVETLNTLGERGAVGDRLSAFPELMRAGDKICLFKRAIFDRQGELVGGGTRIVELFAPTTAASHWLTISDNLYGKDSVEYAGGSSLLFQIESAQTMVLEYVTFSGPDDASLLTFKVHERLPLQ
jgi:hypothetical protein